MAETKIVTVTNEGLQKMKEELEYLKNVKRKEIVESIGIARSFGDLSENSEYDEAKNEQAKVEAQIAELEENLKHVKVISGEEIQTDTVNIGAKVTVLDLDRQTESHYTLVGSTEANPLEGKISDQSPIGKAIIGAKAGDTVVFSIPSGEKKIKIISISR